jgi:hypothetical protein
VKRWHERPVEVRNLFNPAFCGLILFRALQGYEEVDPDGMPFSLTLLVLPLCLRKDSRDVIGAHTRGNFLRIVETHPEITVGIASRTSAMLPYALEAFGLLMERGCIGVNDGGGIHTKADSVRKTISGTVETIACQRVARFLGKEFARIANRTTVYTTLGIRP